MSTLKQPEFTLFPWQLLAGAVPLMAAGGAALAQAHQKPADEVAQVFFAVLAAGNGYLLAAAIGDFGRSMIAMPVGAAAALIGIHLLSYPAARGVYVAILGLSALKHSGAGKVSQPGRALLHVFILLLFILIAFGAAVADTRTTLSPAVVILCYPFVWSMLTASMPAESSFSGRLNAMETGLIASLYGLIFTAIGALVAGLFVSVLPFPRNRDITLLIVAALGLVCGNYVCVKLLFTAASRVMPAEDQPAAAPEEGSVEAAGAPPGESVEIEQP